MRLQLLLFLCLLSTFLEAQPKPLTTDPKGFVIQRMDPPNWWVGMKEQSLEVLVYGNRIADYQVKLLDYGGVMLDRSERLDNPNYIFLTLHISPNAVAGDLQFQFSKEGNQTHRASYSLQNRQPNPNTGDGVTNRDVVYLLMPDRFSNGDLTNDVTFGMEEMRMSRDSAFFRHGGDLQGVINHLDYLQDLGVTALWLTPVYENNQPKESYHGYAITDHYKTDLRLGSMATYRQLIQQAHSKGLKIVQDCIFNHVGNQHYFIKDLPCPDWIHTWNTFTRTNYRAPIIMDPYAAEGDRHIMSDGWFDTHMPDLNQANPHLAHYLIQNSIWWVESCSLDALRIDTYAYPDQTFMRDWTVALQREYPHLAMFGEIWDHGVGIQSYFGNNAGSHPAPLPGVIDFQLQYALNEALTHESGWTEGILRIYYTLAQDYLYANPFRNLIFLDNHDLSRFYSVIGENLDKYKAGTTFLLTTRGVPSLYYGTEILMKNFASLSGVESREDFPGGWATDKTNKFNVAGRTDTENKAFDHLRRLLHYRQQSPALQSGKLMQFVPIDGIYVYFRYTDTQTVMVILNATNHPADLKTDRFSERISTAHTAKNILTDEVINDLQSIHLNAFGSMVLELK